MTSTTVAGDARHAEWPLRRRMAAVALVSGIVVALLPAAFTAGPYAKRWVSRIEIAHGGSELCLMDTVRLRDVFGRDVAWTVVLASLVVVPLVFWYWRRTAMAAARTIGGVASFAAAAAAFVLAQSVKGGSLAFMADGLYWLHVSAGLLFALAFVVAPPPRE